jgi:hypothetical protein
VLGSTRLASKITKAAPIAEVYIELQNKKRPIRRRLPVARHKRDFKSICP